MRWELRIAPLLLLVACGPTRLGKAQGSLAVSPSAVDFGRVYVGLPAHQTIRLRNDSAAAIRVQLSADPPFSVEPVASLEPGAEKALPISVQAQAPGELTGALRLTSELGDRVVDLRAQVAIPPTCSDAPLCQQAHFDADQGACTLQPLPQGTPCSGICVTDGRCSDGACFGAFTSCDDGNACTADACGTSGACVHIPVSCPSPADPCRVAACDPARGCTDQPADDGTRCGPADCVTSQVCIAGACVSRPTPEESPCGEESSCGTTGHCRAGVCEQLPGQPLPPAWSYQPYPAIPILALLSVVDEAGDLFWVESPDDTTLWLVSATRDGVVRFRSQVAGGTSVNADSVVAQGGLIALQVGDSFLAWHTFDGSPAWSLDIQGAAVASGFGSPSSPLDHYQAQVVLAAEQLTLGLEFGRPSQARTWVLAQFDWRTGALSWARAPSPAASAGSVLAGDGQGSLFFVEGEASMPGREVLVSLDQAGQERWRVELPSGQKAGSIAVTGDLVALGLSPLPTNAQLVQDQLAFFRVEDGASPNTASLVGPRVSAPAGMAPGCRSDGQHGAGFFLSGNASTLDEFAPTDGRELLGVQTQATALAFARMSNRQSLFSLNNADGSLLESPLGTGQVSRCLLGGYWLEHWTREPYGDFVLDRGRLVVFDREVFSANAGLFAFEVPGLELASHGWVGPRGNPQRTGTPR